MKILKLLSLWGIVLLTHFQTQAQGGWASLVQGIDFNPYADAIYENPDGSVITCGSLSDFVFGDSIHLYAQKLSAHGNLIWEIMIPKNQTWHFYGFNGITPTSDGGYVLAATHLTNPYLIKVDSAGILQWDSDAMGTDIHAGTYSNHQFIIETGDVLNVISCLDFPANALTIYHLNSNTGELLSESSVPFPFAASETGLGTKQTDYRLTDDGGIIMMMGSKWVWKLNAGLEDEWHYWVDSVSGAPDYNMNGLEKTSDGGYVVCGSYDTTGAYSKSVVIKLNSSGEFVWEKHFGKPGYNASGYSIAERSDGSFVCSNYPDDITLLSAAADSLSSLDLGALYVFNAFGTCAAADDGGFFIGGQYAGSDGNRYYCVLRSSTDGLLPDCIEDCVWPGDADNSGIADMDDLLTLGIAYGTSGEQRSPAEQNNIWSGHNADPWEETLADGTNYKYTDCNGDGEITDDDTLALSLNYAFEHPLFSLRTSEAIPEVYLVPASDTLPLGAVSIPVMLDDAGSDVTLYGIKFSITWSDGEIIDSTIMHMTFEDCWMGAEDELLTMQKLFPEAKTLDVGMTRTDHINVTGSGQIGTLQIVVIDNIAGRVLRENAADEFTLTISDIHAITREEEDVMINGSDYTFKLYSGILSPDNENTITVYPNPATDFIYFDAAIQTVQSITVYSMDGRSQKQFSTQQIQNNKIFIGDLMSGAYELRVRTTTGILTQKLLISR